MHTISIYQLESDTHIPALANNTPGMNSLIIISIISCIISGYNADQFRLCLKDIANTYFTEKYLVIIYWNGFYWQKKNLLYERTQADSFEDSIIKDFSEDKRYTVKVYNGDVTTKPKLRPDHRTRHVILIVDNAIVMTKTKLIEQVRLSKRITHWRTQGQILILVRIKDDDDGLKTVRLMFEVLWEFTKACNTVAVVVKEKHVFNLYKWFPYTDKCDKVGKIHLIDVWRNGSFAKKNYLFQRSGITNLNGCALKVGAFPNPPYILDPVGSRTNFTRGLDIKIVEMLSQIYNFSIFYITLPEGKFPYIIFDSSGKASGFHGMLERQELDIMIFGCRIHELRNMLGDPLDSYIEDALVWVVPTPVPVPSWRNLGDAFSPTVWLLLGVFFVLTSITLYLIANFHRGGEENPTLRTFVSCVMSSLGVLLNNSVPNPKSTLLRLFMFVFFLFAINANSAYQSSLIALLTRERYEKPYVTPMDAVMGGVKTYLFPSGNLTYNQTDHEMWNIIFQPDRHAFIEDFAPVIREIALEKTAMVMMAQNVAGFEVNTKYMTQDNTPRALFLKEKFSLYKVTTYVSLGHPLREHFRHTVNQLVEGGLIDYWLNDVLLTTQREFVSKQEGEGTQALSMQHLQGSFYILFISLLISLQVFCLELLLEKLREKFTSRSI